MAVHLRFASGYSCVSVMMKYVQSPIWTAAALAMLSSSTSPWHFRCNPASTALRASGWQCTHATTDRSDKSLACTHFALAKDDAVFVYASPADIKPQAVVDLSRGAVAIEAEGRLGRVCAFELLTPEKAHFFQARTREDMTQWLAALAKAAPAGNATVVRRGGLMKLGKHKFWSERFVQLLGDHAFYYTKQTDLNIRNSIPLRHVGEVRAAEGKYEKVCVFEVTVAREAGDEIFVFAAENRDDMQAWVGAFAAAVEAAKGAAPAPAGAASRPPKPAKGSAKARLLPAEVRKSPTGAAGGRNPLLASSSDDDE